MADLPETDDGEYDHDFRADPEPYRVARGEQGVFKVQPYKDELLSHWRYADAEAAATAAEAIYEQYLHYRRGREFVGMDMARKYLQMGYTRAMRYARYPGGQKYEDGTEREPVEWADPAKRRAALVFHHVRKRVETDDLYQRRKREWREKRG